MVALEVPEAVEDASDIRKTMTVLLLPFGLGPLILKMSRTRRSGLGASRKDRYNRAFRLPTEFYEGIRQNEVPTMNAASFWNRDKQTVRQSNGYWLCQASSADTSMAALGMTKKTLT